MLTLIFLAAISSVPPSDTYPDWSVQLKRAESLFETHRAAEAAPLFEGAQKMADRLGREELASGICAYRLGKYHFQIGNLLQAERDFLHASEVFDSKLGAGHRISVDAVIQLSSTYLERGEFGKAGSILTSRLEASTSLSLDDRGALLGDLGTVFMYRERFEESERTYRQALEIFERDVLPGSSERIVIAYSNLSAICLRSNRVTEAVEFAERAGEQLETISNPSITLSVKTLANLAVASAYARKEPMETDRRFRSAIRFCEGKLGANHFLLGRILINYADFLKMSDRKGEAKAVRERANSILAAFQKANLLGATIDIGVLKSSSAAR